MSMEDWKWKGLPGHLCVADSCIFRLCTIVGDKMISTVGAYYPLSHNGEMEEIGVGRHYETYVFNVDQYGKKTSGIEIDSDGLKCTDFKNPDKFDSLAEIMHMKMCIKYDNRT